jgi:cytochrome b561
MRNSSTAYGLITILLHWIMAVSIIAMFVLGKYMIGLDYYDPFYHTGPWWHKSIGLIVISLLLFRIIWKFSNQKVAEIENHKASEIKLAQLSQALLYLLMIICCVSGVMISTAEGAAIGFFDLFDIPAIVSLGETQAELAADIHEYSTLALIILAGLHMLAAMKHHFIDKDTTLIKILKIQNKTEESHEK